jgi:acyl-CoA thioesterase
MGERPPVASGCWVERPTAPPPEDCPTIDRAHEHPSIHDHVELRLARGCFGFTLFGEPTQDGRSLLWARMPHIRHDSAALGIIADYMPSVLGNALGRIAHCTSLDNTIRFASRCDTGPDTEWVLCDNRMTFVGAGFGHGVVHMWSQDGALLATGSQSLIVRLPD